jgi:hypothetical protein
MIIEELVSRQRNLTLLSVSVGAFLVSTLTVSLLSDVLFVCPQDARRINMVVYKIFVIVLVSKGWLER